MNFIKPDSNSTANKPKFSWFVLVMVLVVLAASGSAFFFYKKYSGVKDMVSAADNQTTIAAVGKLILLPSDEQPTIATVTDPDKLKEQSFFAHAKVGDKVLIFTKAKKAILYDPTQNKLIEVAPLNLDDANQPSVSGSNSDALK